DTGAVEEEARDRLILLKFRHPLTRESLYRDLAQIRRGLLHKRIAAALEAVYGEAATEHADELAFHLSRASGVAEPRTVGYLELAGSDAVERHADEEAVDYLAAALRAAEELTSPLEPATEDRLRRLLARAQTSAGRFQEAREQLERLLARAEASGDRAAQADVLRHLGINSTFLGRHADALNEFEAARAVVPEDAPTVGAGIELAAGITLQQLGRAEESRQRLVEALRLAELVKDDGLLAWVHRALALINTFGGNSGTARRHAAEAIDRGRAAKDREAVFWGEWVLATLEGLTQGPAPMEPWMAAARESAEALGSPVLDLHVDELELEYLYFTGEWDQALALGTRAIHRARALHKRALVVRLLVWTSSVYIGRGDLDGARLLVDEAVELAGVASGSAPFASDVHAALPALIGLAALRLAERRLDDALESGQAGLALAEASGYVIWALHRLLPIVGEAYVRLDDVERARQVLERFQDEGRRMDHGMSLLWAKAGQALVTWHSGDLEEGARLLGEAAEAMDAMGIPYEAARIRRQHAGRLADLNQTDAARAALDQASDVFQRLGAEPELRATRGMYEEIGVTRRGPTGGPDGRAGLSSREWQVAELVAERKSNHEIARILGIAYRTVTTHCQNIYKKLELEDGPKRIMLGDRVREGRLTRPD
ncbi:MAG: LuxR C-terminal-related transcriptional regulator, partial [Gemmatimonadota bacterium]